MDDQPKYYWLKLKRDFFKRHDTRIIEAMENGEKYILFYLKLLVESIDHSGNLRFSDTIPYNEKMLATITNTDIDIVRTAVKVFAELELMEQLDDGTLYMNQVCSMIGAETKFAEQKRKYRQAKQIEGRTLSRQKKTLSDKSKSIELEKEIDIDSIDKAPKSNIPTIEEVKKYTQEKCQSVDAQHFLDYYLNNGWRDKNNNPVKNWKNKMLTWHKKNVDAGWLPPVQPKKEDRPSDDPVYAEWLKLQDAREAQE